MKLENCTEFGLTVRSRPPAITHGTIWLLTLLLGGGITWMALTMASLVVRAPGLVRPVSSPEGVYVRGNSEALSASATLRVGKVFYHQGDRVNKGDVLILLDTPKLETDIVKNKDRMKTLQATLRERGHELQLKKNEHEAKLAADRKLIDEAKEDVRKAKEERKIKIMNSRVELKVARAKAETTRRLAATRAAGREAMEEDNAKADAAQLKLEQALLPVNEENVAAREQVLATDDQLFRGQESAIQQQIAATEGEIKQAEGDLVNLKGQLAFAEVRAPLTGIVTREEVKVGDELPPGKPFTEIAVENGYNFEAEVTSEDRGHLQLGLPVNIKLDAFDFQSYGTVKGEVLSISPDSTVKEQNGSSRTVYLVKIKLLGEQVGSGDKQGTVSLGLQGTADIVTHEASILSILVKKLKQSISLE
jgi:HlyD family secretion protein